MNNVPEANRIHIGFFGRRNAGKSSVVNAVTNQEMSVVSDVLGTTTDPVKKSMELLPIGPVLIIDTPGYDDEGDLGKLRVQKTKQILNRTDIAVLVVDATEGMLATDEELVALFEAKKLPYVIVYNKCDLLSVEQMRKLMEQSGTMTGGVVDKYKHLVLVSARSKKNIDQLKEQLAVLVQTEPERCIISDLVEQGDVVMLVTPMDQSAPKHRLILPQQQVLRELLDAGVITVVVQVAEIVPALKKLSCRPRLVITDSQVFREVGDILPSDIPLTSFSILMARYKGFLKTAVDGARALALLSDGDRVLICEGCTHHRQCEDIGTVKLPNWLKAYTGKKLVYEFTSGGSFPEDVSSYKVIIHCGGCMLNEKEVMYRMKNALDQGVPFTNYGTAIALTQGILDRSLEFFVSGSGDTLA